MQKLITMMLLLASLTLQADYVLWQDNITEGKTVSYTERETLAMKAGLLVDISIEPYRVIYGKTTFFYDTTIGDDASYRTKDMRITDVYVAKEKHEGTEIMYVYDVGDTKNILFYNTNTKTYTRFIVVRD